MSYRKRCPQCERDFESQRPDAITCSEECKYQRRIERSLQPPCQPVREHPLAEVRADQEQIDGKARWTLIVREHMARTLLATGYFHADDLDPLGIPEEHRNIAGSQAGGFVSRGLMEEVGRRASSKPSRKKAKSAIYRVTAKGRNELQAHGVASTINKSSTPAKVNPQPSDIGAEDREVPGGESGVPAAPEGLQLFPETALERMQDKAA